MKKHMTDLNKFTTAELHKELISVRQEIIELRRGVIIGDVQNNQLATQKRRHLARIKMILSRPVTDNKLDDAVTSKKVAKKTTVKEKK